MKVWLLLTAALWITGALCRALPGIQNSLKCDPEKQYEHHGQCCNKCPPGTFMKAKCTPFANTTCHPCGPNGYMSVWNEDLSCTLFMVCDAGKALRISFKGNSTYPRECECFDGYHFDTKLELCLENSKCPLGFGVQIPVQSNKNTVCVPCPVGYYSNTSSATGACTQWTNCTDVGLKVIVPGTDISDAKCDRQSVLPDLTKMVILIIFIIVATGIVICIIYIVHFRKNYSAFIGQEKQSYDQVHKSQEKVFSKQIESKDCIHRVHSSSGDHDPLKESVTYQGRLIPTEDEYMDQRKSPEPENGSMAAGTDSTSDIGSLGTVYGFSDTSSDRLLPPSQEEGVSIPLYSHHHCGQSAKEIQDNYARGPVACSHCASQQTFQGFSQATHPTPERNDGEEPCFCFTDRQYSRSESSASSTTTTDPPSPPSGNVTGNHNTTVISTAPVMNIKTDLVVVYYNSASQETPTVNENVDTMRRPTQEESQSHYDSFVGNTQPPRYRDIPCSSVSDTDSKMFVHQLSSQDSLDMFSQEQPSIFLSPNASFLPVQEEGKPEFYL
ncbi:tumor necrosis factor receptor superfamily member 11A [Hyla sarda]|uniref:tumor necrosis factor receptor superfamily member 11A n=1 Tax=Hyla sarda TaxID=327740 RepID=UPI0024C20D0D|nr:tumor necrosis factor receptor superfamily member 11A [Hyla sarda]